jgi:hypothetical protein
LADPGHRFGHCFQCFRKRLANSGQMIRMMVAISLEPHLERYAEKPRPPTDSFRSTSNTSQRCASAREESRPGRDQSPLLLRERLVTAFTMCAP